MNTKGLLKGWLNTFFAILFFIVLLLCITSSILYFSIVFNQFFLF